MYRFILAGNKSKYNSLLQEIKDLEKKLAKKKMEVSALTDEVYSVSVPAVFRPQFKKLQDKISTYFSSLDFDPSNGRISINEERYLLTRSSSLSYDFFQGLITLLDENTGEGTFELAYDLLFDIAHIIGKKDAEKYAVELVF